MEYDATDSGTSDPVSRMLSQFSDETRNEVARFQDTCSPQERLFLNDMLTNESHRARSAGGVNGKEEFIRFAVQVAPVAAHFPSQVTYTNIDKWMYLGHVLRLQSRAAAVTEDEVADFNRGIVLTVLVDRLRVNQNLDRGHLVWLGANWSGIEPYLPLLVERSSVDHSLVTTIFGGVSGPPILSPGIL